MDGGETPPPRMIPTPNTPLSHALALHINIKIKKS